MSVWVRHLIRDGVVAEGVLFDADADGTVVAETTAGTCPPEALELDLAASGFANAHSHAFHRALRGRTHASGSFWTWRALMYRAAGRLDPDGYRELATAVFSEMVLSGWTAAGEFHYLHHAPDGTPYADHAMELALADAAEAAGIRLVLLDTCYLAGGIGRPLAPEQVRFADADAAAFLARWHALRDALADRSPLVTLGAALHSVRAVPREAIGAVARGLPASVPLHVHLSEQPAENADCVAAHGMTPTALLAAEHALTERLSVVHATHLDADDIRMLGEARVTAVLCPTTEADLGDGIGPAAELASAGARLAIGSDQNAVVDPLLELRGLEAGERLRSLRRGRIAPADLWRIGSDSGYAALGLERPARVGGPLDLVELDAASVRTAGSDPRQLPMTATAADVTRVVIGGRVVDHDEREVAARLRASIDRIFTEAP